MASLTMNYILLVALAGVLGGLGGLIAHVARSSSDVDEVSEYNESGFIVRTNSRRWSEHHGLEKEVIGARWNEDGTWDASSLRNIAYMILGGVLIGMVPLLAA